MAKLQVFRTYLNILKKYFYKMLKKPKSESKCGQIKIQLFSFEIWQRLQGGKKQNIQNIGEHGCSSKQQQQHQQAHSEIAKTLRRRWCLEEKLRSKPPTSFFINSSAFFLSSWASSLIFQFSVSINLLEE
jgi:hypothetical protein